MVLVTLIQCLLFFEIFCHFTNRDMGKLFNEEVVVIMHLIAINIYITLHKNYVYVWLFAFHLHEHLLLGSPDPYSYTRV